jgi:tetratricopeptide (TPR) repeat protein
LYLCSAFLSACIIISCIEISCSSAKVLAQGQSTNKPNKFVANYGSRQLTSQYSAKTSKYFFNHQYEKCIASAKEWIRLEPNSAWSHIYLGLCYWRQESFKPAEAELSKGLNGPNANAPVDVYVARGECYIALGQPDKAIADFTAGLKKDPKSEFVLTRRAEVYCQMKQFKAAISDATSFVAVSRAPRSYLFRGRIYLDSGDYKKAIEDFSSAIKLDPGVAEYYSMRAVCYEKLGRRDLAKADRDKGNQIDPLQADR